MLTSAFKGSMTHLQVLQISMKFLLPIASDIRRILWEFQNSEPLTLEIRNKFYVPVTQIFFFFVC